MGQMIKFEHGMLVLNSLMTKEDVAAINEFADYVRSQENERIIKVLEELEKTTFPGDVWHINPFRYAIDIVNQENK